MMPVAGTGCRHTTSSSTSSSVTAHRTFCVFQRGELHSDRLRSARPDLGGPLPTPGSQPVAHQEHYQHAQLTADWRESPLPAAFPKQPLWRESAYDPGDGVAVSALFFSDGLFSFYFWFSYRSKYFCWPVSHVFQWHIINTAPLNICMCWREFHFVKISSGCCLLPEWPPFLSSLLYVLLNPFISR